MPAVTGTLVNNADAVSIGVQGPCLLTIAGTYTGQTVNFQASPDGGTTWVPVVGVPVDAVRAPESSRVLPANGTGIWFFNLPYQEEVKLQVVAAGAMGGTANVWLVNLVQQPNMPAYAPPWNLQLASPPAGGFSVGGNLTVAGLIYESATSGITANAGGGQAGAVALTTEVNRVSVVATLGDSVKLPPATPGTTLLVINHGANAAQVFGAGTDTINDVAAATGVSQMPTSTVFYVCTNAGNWYTEGLASGFSGGYATQAFSGGITAHAGGGQGSAVLLTAMVNRVATVASGGDSVLLPATVANVSIGPLTVMNAGANSCNVFPNTGDQINAGGANAAFAVASGKTATFYSAGSGQWHAVLSA